jgi:hypothetical protein
MSSREGAWWEITCAAMMPRRGMSHFIREEEMFGKYGSQSKYDAILSQTRRWRW